MDENLAKFIVDTSLIVGEIPLEILARYQLHIPELTPELIYKALRRIEANPSTNGDELAFYRLKVGKYPDTILQSPFVDQIKFVCDMLEPWDPVREQEKFDSNEGFCLTKVIYGLDFLKSKFIGKALEDMNQ